MRRKRVARILLLALVCIAAIPFALSSCGSSTPKAPPVVELSLTAPVDGARVAVNKVRVFGTVSPPNAAVRVAGRRVHVSNGAFRRWVALRDGFTNIGVIATAPGYVRASLRVAVHKVSRRDAGRPAPPQRSGLDGANQLCARADSKILATLFPQLSKPAGASDYMHALHQLTSTISRLVGRLQAFRPPPAKAAAYHAFVNHMRGLLGDADQLVADVQARQTAKLAPIVNRMVAALSGLGREGTTLGLISCANDFTTPS